MSACNAGDLGSIPGLGRSPGEGNGNPIQYSCLENLMDTGAWWATVHGVAKSRTGLRDFTFTFFQCIYMESRKMVLMSLFAGQELETQTDRLTDTVGEGEGGTN